jgi:outer membrane biosynthesis protein TonB
MAGLKAPMPRAYPALRFASVFAALLFFLTYATNFAVPRLRAASAPAYGYGMGGGGGGAAESSAATEAPAQTEAPLLAPAATQPPEEGPPLTQMQPIAPTTATPSTAEDATRIMETPSTKNAGPQESENAPQPEVREEAPLPAIWQWSLGILALLLGLVAWLSNLFSERAFRKKIK